MAVDSANVFATPRFPSLLSTHLHARNKFFPYNIILWWLLPDQLRWEGGGGRTKAHISSAFQSTTSFSSNGWSELLMNNGWQPDEYAHSLLCLWGLVNNLWAKMFLTLLLYKNHEKKTIFTLWAGQVICQSDSSPAIHFHIIAKIKYNKIYAFRGGRSIKHEHAQPHSLWCTSFQKLWLLILKDPWIINSTQGPSPSWPVLLTRTVWPIKMDYSFLVLWKLTNHNKHNIIKLKSPEIFFFLILKAFRENKQINT